jgi:hypothetical protein
MKGMLTNVIKIYIKEMKNEEKRKKKPTGLRGASERVARGCGGACGFGGIVVRVAGINICSKSFK